MNEEKSAIGIEQDEDWQVLKSFLPEGWEEEARRTGALKRVRGVKSAESLLRVLLIHLGNGLSLSETCVQAEEKEIAKIRPPSLQHRLEGSCEWLRWLADGVRREKLTGLDEWIGKLRRRVLVVDGTSVSEPGSTGTDWRVHYSIELSTLNCAQFLVTGPKVGETFKRFEVRGNDLVMGDRGYSHRCGVRHIKERGGNVIVRVNWASFPVVKADGTPFDPIAAGRTMSMGDVAEWMVLLPGEEKTKPPIAGRIVGMKKSAAAAALAQKKLRQTCLRKGKKLTERALELAKYFFVFSDVSGDELTGTQILELYRARWQVELAFKQLKSILGLGHLPKVNPRAAQAWLHGKLLVALLAQAIVRFCESFSPWGYRIRTRKSGDSQSLQGG